MTKNNISRAFSDLSVKRSAIPNIYTIFCNSGQRGVVDTSLEYDCQLSYWHLAIVLYIFFFFLFYFGFFISTVA